MNEIRLGGCTPTPLANYLKALGILRLVAEQKDEQAMGHWEGECFVLSTALDRDELIRFFLDEYRPTPIIAPWNGGSGFYPNDNKDGISAVQSSPSPRFEPYRNTISLAQQTLNRMSLEESPKDKGQKAVLLTTLRAQLPDDALAWMDAAILLGGDDPKYPPLLGTGGNDGRLDFTNNFMQRLGELFDGKGKTATQGPEAWLLGALSGNSTPFLASKAIGQFSPGGVGGPNASTGYEGGSLVNPWDFILMIEGALPFAAAATRRMEAAGNLAALSYPFTVRATGSGSGSAALSDEGNARAEMWLPLWHAPATYGEIRALMSEGRVTLGRQPVHDGLEFARAIAALGVNRGIDTFQRFGFLMRSGKAYLATPLNRFEVRKNRQAALLSDLDKQQGWLNRLRRVARQDEMPARLKSLVRQLEDAIFALSQGARDARPSLQQIIALLGEIQMLCHQSPKVREALRTPVPRLGAQWVIEANDGSSEFRLASALAGLYGGKGKSQLNMKRFITPVTAEGYAWDNESRNVVWVGGGLTRNLIAVLGRMLQQADALGLRDKPLFSARYCHLDDVAAFLNRQVDDAKIARLIPGLALVEIPQDPGGHRNKEAQIHLAYTLLKPLFTPDAALQKMGFLHGDQRLAIPSGLLRRLSNPATFVSGMELARRRLRAFGLKTPPKINSASGIDVERLTAALLIPVNYQGLKKLCTTIGMKPAEQESETNH